MNTTNVTRNPMIVPMIGMMAERTIESTVSAIHRTIHATPKTIDCAACHRTTWFDFSMRKKMMPVIGGIR